jgi:hypothetical protein
MAWRECQASLMLRRRSQWAETTQGRARSVVEGFCRKVQRLVGQALFDKAWGLGFGRTLPGWAGACPDLSPRCLENLLAAPQADSVRDVVIALRFL